MLNVSTTEDKLKLLIEEIKSDVVNNGIKKNSNLSDREFMYRNIKHSTSAPSADLDSVFITVVRLMHPIKKR